MNKFKFQPKQNAFKSAVEARKEQKCLKKKRVHDAKDKLMLRLIKNYQDMTREMTHYRKQCGELKMDFRRMHINAYHTLNMIQHGHMSHDAILGPLLYRVVVNNEDAVKVLNDVIATEGEGMSETLGKFIALIESKRL